MDIKTAKERIMPICGKEIGSLIAINENIDTYIRNKGSMGQTSEILIGKKPDNSRLDFSDGEMKTYKSTEDGKPLETICITQLSSILDDCLGNKDFRKSVVFKKIQNVLFVSVFKKGSFLHWKYIECVHVDLSKEEYKGFLNKLSEDYSYILKEIEKSIKRGENIHTISGKNNYLQIRTKDSKNKSGNYHPIFSKTYGRYVSNKNYAFYFKKNFLNDILKKRLTF